MTHMWSPALGPVTVAITKCCSHRAGAVSMFPSNAWRGSDWRGPSEAGSKALAFQTGSHSLSPVILLPQPLQSWDYRCRSPHMAGSSFSLCFGHFHFLLFSAISPTP